MKNKNNLFLTAMLAIMLAFGMMVIGCDSDPYEDDTSGGYDNYSSSSGKLSTPTNVKATATSSSSITITWNAVYGAKGYDVHRSSSLYGTYIRVGSPTSGTSYTNTGLNASTTYYYKVSAWKDTNYNNDSLPSTAVYATTYSSGGSSPTTTTLTQGSWTTGYMTAGATQTYQFYGYAGSTYYIKWQDSENSSTCTANVMVGVRGAASIKDITNTGGYAQNCHAFTVSGSGYFFVDVKGYYSTTTGSYRIEYSTYY